MTRVDDFFSSAVDSATGHADCPYCGTNSKVGGGRWNSVRTEWVCDTHIPDEDAYQAEQRAERYAALLRNYGPRGRYFLVAEFDPGDTITEGEFTFKVAQKAWMPGDEGFERGWYVKIDVL